MARTDFRAAASRRLSEDGELTPAIVSLLSSDSPTRTVGVRVVRRDEATLGRRHVVDEEPVGLMRDPLSERVHLSKPELLGQSIGGMVSEMIRRAAGRRPMTKPAAGA